MKEIAWLMLALSVAFARAGESSDKKMNTTNTTELATFGGGCFWCLEAVFERLDGVELVTSGYAGGKKDKPTYQEVCSGNTGHAEVVQIAFDAKKISYDKLLEIFWAAHDPTTVNQQGADVGANRDGNSPIDQILQSRGLPSELLSQPPECALLRSRHQPEIGKAEAETREAITHQNLSLR